jgi:RHS repeat-associated protein
VPGSEVDCVRFQYDADGKRTKVTYPTTPTAVTVDYTYPTDGGAYIKELEVKRGVTSLIDLSYTYASGGSDTEQVRTRVDNLTANVWSYGYDTRNRLCWANQSNVVTTGTCSSPPAGANKYVFDANGNRTSQVSGGNTTTYKYDGVNESCWIYAGTSSNACGSPPSGAETHGFDGAGNMTSRSDGFSSVYNAKHQPVSVDHPGGGGAMTAVYSDVDSTERVQLGSTYFDNGPLGVMRSTDSGVTATWTRDNRGGLVSQHRSDSSNERYYYVLDRLDTVIGLIDSSGNLDNTYRYSPHGRMFAGTEVVPNPWRFQSGYQDDDRSVKFGTRFYDTTTGRFTQPDPLAGSVWDPMVANRYAFAANDPVNMSDPTGYCVLGLVGDCDNPVNDYLVGAVRGGIATGTAGFVTGCLATLPAGCVAGGLTGMVYGIIGGGIAGGIDNVLRT